MRSFRAFSRLFAMGALAVLSMSAAADRAEALIPLPEKVLEILDKAAARSERVGLNFGAENGSVTVYQFFDYNCGYCRRSVAFLKEMEATYPDLTIYVLDNPVLGDASVEAAVAMAQLPANIRQTAHFDAMKSGRRNADWVRDYAAKNKLNKEITGDPKSETGAAVMEDIKYNYAIAQGVGFRGVPGFIVNTANGADFIGGFVPGRIEKLICGYDGIGSCAQSSRLLFEDALTLQGRGEADRALEMMEDATKASVQSVDTNHLNDICWKGSKQGFAKSVLATCERLVELAPNNAGYRDSRGLAFALSDARSEAISDFEYYISANETNAKKADAITMRRKMIELLKTGSETEITALSKQLK